MSLGFKADPSGLFGTVTIDGVDSLVINKDGSIVGNNFVSSSGQILSAGATNHIIDGDFNFWYEGNSQTSSGYGSDTMWNNLNTGSTKVNSKQEFALGQADVPGNPVFYSRHANTSVGGASNRVLKQHRFEDVRGLAGKRVTLSFWAKADSAKDISVEWQQYFGTGGSPSATIDGIGIQKVSLTTSWAKYTMIVDIPSISGKTVGTDSNHFLIVSLWMDAGSDFDSRTDTLGQQSGTFDFARIRLVEGEEGGDHISESVLEDMPRVSRYFQLFVGVDGVVNYYTADYATIGPISYPSMRSIPTLSIVTEPTAIGSGVIEALQSTGREVNNVSFAYNATATAGYAARFVSMAFTLDARL